MRIDICRERIQFHISKVTCSYSRHNSRQYRNVLSVVFIDHRTHYNDQQNCGSGCHQHILGRMDTDVHSGKRNQNCDSNATNANPFFLGNRCNRTEGSDCALRVAAGKRIAGSRFPGLFQNSKITVQHPRPGNPEEKLHKLVSNRTHETDTQHIVAMALVDAPEDDHRNHQKCRFLTQPGDQQHQLIQSRYTDLFQQIQKLHSISSKSFLLLYQEIRKCKDSVQVLCFFDRWDILYKTLKEDILCFTVLI